MNHTLKTIFGVMIAVFLCVIFLGSGWIGFHAVRHMGEPADQANFGIEGLFSIGGNSHLVTTVACGIAMFGVVGYCWKFLRIPEKKKHKGRSDKLKFLATGDGKRIAKRLAEASHRFIPH